jgi:hypothetical protein
MRVKSGSAMGNHSDPLEGLSARTISEDQSVSLTLSSGSRLELWIHPAAYRRYQEETLDAVLTVAMTEVWAEYRRRFFQTVSRATGVTVRENQHEGAAMREFRRNWRALAVEGTTPGQRIRIQSEGLTRWRIRIRQGTLRALPCDEFVAEFTTAFQALIDDYHEKITALKDQHFDLRLPGKTPTRDWR